MSVRYDNFVKSRAVRLLVLVVMSFSLFIICGASAYSQHPDYKKNIAQSSVTFFSGNQDIPVMPGLTELEAHSFSYDKPEGEIIELVAGMDGVTDEQVLYYYDVTLPQFGWNRVVGESDGGHYYRKDEYLDIAFDEQDGRRFVRIMIRPSR